MKAELQPLIQSLRDILVQEPELDPLHIESLILPSLRLTTHRGDEARLELGASRIGGEPDVPPGFEWPRWMPSRQQVDKFGDQWRLDARVSLGFIAQIDLSAIPHIDATMPRSGWLYFFYDRYCEPWGYDPADRGCCRVVYIDCPRASLQRAELPRDFEEEHLAYPCEHVAHHCEIEAVQELTLPEYFSVTENRISLPVSYYRLARRLVETSGTTKHRLLGHPQHVQGPMELECQLASNGIFCGDSAGYLNAKAAAMKAGAADWRLLLQIDTDEAGPGWYWGDGGRIYFWIKRHDLAARRFDDVWLVFQCC